MYTLRHTSLNLPGFSTEAAFSALFAHSPHAFWLDSSRVMPGYSRFSMLGDASGPLAEVIAYRVKDRRIAVHSSAGEQVIHGDLFDYLKQMLATRRIDAPALPFAFCLGYVGYFGYEMKSLCDGAAAHEAPTPDAAFIFCDRALVFDHETGEITLLCLTAADEGHVADAWFADMQARLRSLPIRGGLGRGPLFAPTMPPS